MKKIFILFLLLTLTGCSFTKEKEDVNYLRYKDSLSLVENAVNFVEKSDNFDIELEVTNSNNGYQYYLIIDNPRNAMYNVRSIAIVDGVNYNDDLMAPNFGIFGDDSVNLVPHQYYPDGGYLKGIVLNGISNTADFSLKAMVSWTDESNETTYYEYLTISTGNEVVESYE